MKKMGKYFTNMRYRQGLLISVDLMVLTLQCFYSFAFPLKVLLHVITLFVVKCWIRYFYFQDEHRASIRGLNS